MLSGHSPNKAAASHAFQTILALCIAASHAGRMPLVAFSPNTAAGSSAEGKKVLKL
jgi:hypothetical protein